MFKLQKKIEDIFYRAKNQAEALNEIYKLFVPHWDQIALIDGWPLCGALLHRFIAERFVSFDIDNHPDVMAGGLWFNKGFSEDSNLRDWEVNLEPCLIKAGEEECFT